MQVTASACLRLAVVVVWPDILVCSLSVLKAAAVPCVQVKQWSKQELHAFWRKWYFPANATLYIVGDLSEPRGVRDAIASIEAQFGKVAPKVDGDGALMRRGPVRPPVEHGWGIGPIRNGALRPSRC